jgi:hypothetical protein
MGRPDLELAGAVQRGVNRYNEGQNSKNVPQDEMVCLAAVMDGGGPPPSSTTLCRVLSSAPTALLLIPSCKDACLSSMRLCRKIGNRPGAKVLHAGHMIDAEEVRDLVSLLGSGGVHRNHMPPLACLL